MVSRAGRASPIPSFFSTLEPSLLDSHRREEVSDLKREIVESQLSRFLQGI